MSTATYTKTGAKSTSKATLPKDVFAVEVKSHDLLKQVYVSLLSNQRKNNARALERGEVRGGGRKPWKQKGTGRARVGSIRSPLWRGGGVTFGPTGNENFTKKINKKAKITALKQALTLNSDNVSVIDSIDLKGKTKNAADLFSKLELSRGVLLIAEKKDATLRACSNLDYVSVVDAKELNVLDVLDAHAIVIEKDQLKALDERLGGKNE